MFSTIALQIPTDTMHELLSYLRSSGSELDPSEAAGEAIAEWLARARKDEQQGHAFLPTGYQWKSLFLPEGTRLNVFCKGEHGYAYVVGDKLIYKGRSTSPNKFAKEVSGHVRNAWEDIMVRFPGENRPKMACVLRRQLQAETELQRRAGQSREAETLPAKPEAPQPAAESAATAAGEWPYVDRRALRVYPGDIPFS